MNSLQQTNKNQDLDSRLDDALNKKDMHGAKFLHQRDSSLHTSAPVKHEADRKKKIGEKVSQNPVKKISDWLKVLEKTHFGHGNNLDILQHIKSYYHKQHVINPENVPQSYYKNQQRLARELGHGNIEITPELKKQAQEVIIADQKSTLDNWLDYFLSSDSETYPMWSKYWAFNSMLKLSTFDKEKHKFGKRKNTTVAPFPDINREALAHVMDAIMKETYNETTTEIEDAEFQELLKNANFGKLYAWMIEKVTPAQVSELLNIKGKWIKYNQNSDHIPLVESLQGHGTGWCTAGEETAKIHLQGGDFYVYYSYGEGNKPTIPRVAIRMQENEIGEIRGIAAEQNLDPDIVQSNILEDKLTEFGAEGEKYEKRTSDMKRLTEIDKKNQKGNRLIKEDLSFLYELENQIEGFGYKKDPRIQEILEGRETKKDISGITGLAQNLISITKKEALEGNIKFHYGDLSFNNLTSAEGLELPETINGGLYLKDLTSAEGLKLPEIINGNLNLWSLKSAMKLELPETMNGDLYLNSLTSAEGLELPETINGGLYLKDLTSAEGLKLPEIINGNLNLWSLKSAMKLELPETMNGDLYLNSLTSAEGLELPETINGALDLGNLTSAQGLKLPETIKDYLNLNHLTSADELEFPETINGHLYLNCLTSAEGLKLPETINGNLYFGSLTSAQGLELPETINGNLYLGSLTSAEGLKLPEMMGGSIYLDNLTSLKKQNLREKYPSLDIKEIYS